MSVLSPWSTTVVKPDQSSRSPAVPERRVPQTFGQSVSYADPGELRPGTSSARAATRGCAGPARKGLLHMIGYRDGTCMLGFLSHITLYSVALATEPISWRRLVLGRWSLPHSLTSQHPALCPLMHTGTGNNPSLRAQ